MHAPNLFNIKYIYHDPVFNFVCIKMWDVESKDSELEKFYVYYISLEKKFESYHEGFLKPEEGAHPAYVDDLRILITESIEVANVDFDNLIEGGYLTQHNTSLTDRDKGIGQELQYYIYTKLALPNAWTKVWVAELMVRRPKEQGQESDPVVIGEGGLIPKKNVFHPKSIFANPGQDYICVKPLRDPSIGGRPPYEFYSILKVRVDYEDFEKTPSIEGTKCPSLPIRKLMCEPQIPRSLRGLVYNGYIFPGHKEWTKVDLRKAEKFLMFLCNELNMEEKEFVYVYHFWMESSKTKYGRSR